MDDSEITWPYIHKGGWSGWFVYIDSINDSVLRGLRVASHFFDHESTLIKSSFNLTVASSGLSSRTYKLESLAISRGLEVILLTVSFIYIKNSGGPNIDPCGIPALIALKFDEYPLIETF